MKRLMGKLLQLVGLLTLVGALVFAAGMFFAGKWLKVNDPPEKADAIVLLGGGFARPLFGADLYLEDWAPLVYVSRPAPDPVIYDLAPIGVDLPVQEDIYTEILERKRVPLGAIRYFGNGMVSTVEEGETLARVFNGTRPTLLVVTSPYHTRRAKTVLENTLPNARIVMTATPYEAFPENWWTDYRAATSVVLETAKTLHYMLGGAFRSDSAGKRGSPYSPAANGGSAPSSP